jgi:hypothetical protein
MVRSNIDRVLRITDRMGVSLTSTDQARRAGGSTRSPASVRRWPPLWPRALLIQRHSDRGVTSRPGLRPS